MSVGYNGDDYEHFSTMIQTVSAAYLTLEQYLAHTADTDICCELVNGTLVEMPPESDENLSIARRLLLELIKCFPADQVTWDTEIAMSGQQVSCRIPDLLVQNRGPGQNPRPQGVEAPDSKPHINLYQWVSWGVIDS
ncbi:MAG: hypothetical protein AAGF93_15040 [Cyanobacteria bacterium P01_H01_bin.105]